MATFYFNNNGDLIFDDTGIKFTNDINDIITQELYTIYSLIKNTYDIKESNIESMIIEHCPTLARYPFEVNIQKYYNESGSVDVITISGNIEGESIDYTIQRENGIITGIEPIKTESPYMESITKEGTIIILDNPTHIIEINETVDKYEPFLIISSPNPENEGSIYSGTEIILNNTVLSVSNGTYEIRSLFNTNFPYKVDTLIIQDLTGKELPNDVYSIKDQFINIYNAELINSIGGIYVTGHFYEAYAGAIKIDNDSTAAQGYVYDIYEFKSIITLDRSLNPGTYYIRYNTIS